MSVPTDINSIQKGTNMKKLILSITSIIFLFLMTGCYTAPSPYSSSKPITTKVILAKSGMFTSNDPFYINGKRIYKGYFAEDNLTIVHRGKVSVTRDGSTKTTYLRKGEELIVFYSALVFSLMVVQAPVAK